MASKSKLLKVLILLLSVVLVISTLGANVGEAKAEAQSQAQAVPKNHVHYSTTYQTVYANPNVNKEEAAFLYALITLHPKLKAIKHLKDFLVAVGLWRAFVAIMDREEKAKKAQGYYILEKKIYKAKKPTKNYWGYHVTYIYSSALRKKEKGKVMVIGKTGY